MNCPICLNSAAVPGVLAGYDFLFESTARGFRLSGCGRCNSLFLDPPPDEQELASFYPEEYWWHSSSGTLSTLERWYRRVALRDHVSFVMRSARELEGGRTPLRLLDVGCGSGTFLSAVKRCGLEVTGFDCSERAADLARTESGVNVIVGSKLEDAEFPPASFDLVTLFHVLEHVTDPRRLLAEVHRILRPGGRVILQVPNIESWQFRLFGVRWYGLDIPRHVVDFSSRSVARLLRDSGFLAGRLRHFNLRDNAPALASSLAPRLDPARRNVRSRSRGTRESRPAAWTRHILYIGLVVMSYPFAVAESAAGAGATIMLEGVRPGGSIQE